nr:phospholipase [Micromonospora sp. DSM 115978]
MRRTRTARMISRALASTVAAAVVLLGAVGTALPAQAEALKEPAAPALPGQTAVKVDGLSATKADVAKRPAGPRSTMNKGDTAVMKLDAGSAARMVAAAPQAAGCTPYISGYVSKSGLMVRIDYLAEIVCNFYLAGAGQAYLIERTGGSPYNGQVVAAATPFSFYNGYYGYSLGAVLIDGRVYDGGAVMEVGFDLGLQTLNGATWAGCFALPAGHRYLSPCYGLGTTYVSVAVGTGGFGTGLAPGRLDLLASWTQTSESSSQAFHTARQNQAAYAVYEFDWSNDLCTWAPDNPLGFSFERSCIRHDFGYRNYKAAQRFPENKPRIDSAFYEDLKRVCAGYDAVLQPPCYALAWLYYEATVIFGRVMVTDDQIAEVAKLMPEESAGKALAL